MPVSIGIHRVQCRVEARRHEQVLEVLVAAVREEINDFLVSPDGLHDLRLLEGSGPVLVDQVEALARHREELGAELGVRLGRRALPPLALRGQLGEPLREAALDRLLPFVHIYLSRAVLVEDLEGLLEARGLQQELEVLFAAVSQERNDFLVFLYSLDNFSSRQRAAAVLVDELEALPSRVEEIAREFRNLALRRKGVELALCGSLGKLVFERDLDALLPAWNIDR